MSYELQTLSPDGQFRPPPPSRSLLGTYRKVDNHIALTAGQDFLHRKICPLLGIEYRPSITQQLH
jgi:hypothetical protein